jgi:hypothetical protein
VDPRLSDGALLEQRTLSRWENEGGSVIDQAQCVPGPEEERLEVPELTNAEVVQLRIRVIALEGLVAALLVDATDQQLDRAREMAAFITPRSGSTPHSLTIRAAAQMIHLLERAGQFPAQMSPV